MKICQYIDSFSQASGGGSIFASDLNKELNKTMESVIVSRKWTNEPLNHNHNKVTKMSPAIDPMYVAKYKPLNYVRFELQNANLIKYLRKIEVDILQIHGETVPLIPHLSLPQSFFFHPWMASNKPVCFTVHALWSLFKSEPSVRKSERRMFEKVDHIIVVEKFLKRHIVESFNVDENKISYLPSGILLSQPDKIDDDISFTDNQKIVFTAARLSPERNVDMIIKAASIILSYRKDVVFVIAGGGALFSELRRLAFDLGISDKVVFLGSVKHEVVLSIMRKCYAVVNSTTVPGASKMTLESFANKKPVVRAKTIDTYPVIDNNTGIVYDPTNPADLAEKITLLLKDENLAKKLGKKGYEIVAKEYNLNNIVKGYVKIYEELLSGN